MSQSTRIAATLILLFLVFITAKGELPTYLGFFAIGKATPDASIAASASSGSGASSATSDSDTSTVGSLLNLGLQSAEIFAGF